MKRSLQHPYTTSHTTVEARNPRILLTSRIPVLLQVLQRNPKNPSNEQNSSSSTGSTESKRQCFRCGEPFSKKHMKECRAQNVTCNGCGIKGHLKKCCKKSGNFPKDSSNRQNQSSSTGSAKMNFASTLPQTEAEFFDEKGLLKE